jgi:hypothetical protein
MSCPDPEGCPAAQMGRQVSCFSHIYRVHFDGSTSAW